MNPQTSENTPGPAPRAPLDPAAGRAKSPGRSARPQRLRFGPAGMARAAALALGNVALLWLVRLNLSHAPARPAWWVQGALGAGALFAAVFIAVFHWRHWSAPCRRMRDLLRDVRAGEEPIESLSAVGGGLRPLAAQVQELLRDLRRQKAQMAALEGEMSQRVARRTDALERSMGLLRAKATRDALTGLYNRRMLEEYLPPLVRQCREGGGGLCVMMIDVDYFKQLNDTLGHAAGDELLRSIGQIIRSTVRASDLPFRFGGDEFCVVVPGIGQPDARALAERLVSLVDALTKPLRVAKPPRLSIGLALLADLPADAAADDLMKAADKHLYAVKSARKSHRAA